MKTTVEKLAENVKDARRDVYLVKDETGRVVGMLEKYRNTRTDRHPWKAISGHGFDARFIGAYYDRDGGRTAALAAVVAAAPAV